MATRPALREHVSQFLNDTFQRQLAHWNRERLAPDSPMPEQFVRNAYADPTSQFFGGLWRSGVGAWRVHYTEHELCVLRSGRVRIRDDDGREWTFGPGECFVIPAGFRGLWEVLEPAEKFYAIYEPRTG